MRTNLARLAGKGDGRSFDLEGKGGYGPAQKSRKARRGGREQPQRKKEEKWNVIGPWQGVRLPGKMREKTLVSPK